MGIPYVHDNYLVRGLDYYNQTVFEVISNKLGGQDALCGGGRYNKLISQLGGDDIPAVGFAAGVERRLADSGDAVGLKTVYKNDINTRAHDLLQQTDWYVIRKYEDEHKLYLQ